MAYRVADGAVSDEISVSRSRFICYLAHCSSAEQAKQQVLQCKQQHPQASHHCYAFIAGAPQDGQRFGCSDDGEPSGTAGRPMLSVLQGSGLGEICAVVVRYFGGTKLGTGGLQRAYANSVRQALAFLPSKAKIPMVHKALACQYTQLNDVLHVVEQCSGEVLAQHYGQQVALKLALPDAAVVQVQQQLLTLSAGLLQLNDVCADE